MTLAAANANYLKASNALTEAHAAVRALTANKAKTVALVAATYDRLDAVRAEFNAAKATLDTAERT
jgi:hypothetical protein